ncbi:ubiquinol-cytochrome C chaperone family protein [Lutibaculum baratangense]|uniref:Ubiquinol-cytochrome C chaperone n=1 Tax=Lutibaculum baratangense AMV1 TaxID=631454 RepID=V4RAS0_9HYPH|nr:ubiquinol-cytochrome C chaperone family protein [Lutibaculum baratangense]ESR23276.1 Ubiquinol-cytochrome C chaperone [Lutibaculum baratangense AMV1]
MLQRLFRPAARDAARPLYDAVVAQARQPVFYAEIGVPDTPEGRYDLIVLHVILVLRRLRAEGEDGRRFGQHLFDTLFRDMDRSLREMGVGDLIVPKRIRKMGEAFYGRAGRYEPALEARDEAALAEGIAANILGRDPDAQARRLAQYALAAEATLRDAAYDDLRRGELAWPTA